MSEMNARLKELLHRNDGHQSTSFRGFSLRQPGLPGDRSRPQAAPATGACGTRPGTQRLACVMETNE